MLTSRYDINNLSFLIGFYSDLVQTFEKSDKAMLFYKRQIAGLVNTGHLTYADSQLIEQVIGIDNNSKIDWKSADSDIAQFKLAMNSILSTTDEIEAVVCLRELASSNQINSKIEEIIKDIFGITYKSKYDKKENNNSFGSIPDVKIDKSKISETEELKIFNSMINKYKRNKCCIRIINMIHGEKVYVTIRITEIAKNKEIREALANGADFEIANEQVTSDSEKTYIEYMQRPDVTKIFKSLDWDKINIALSAK